MTFRVLYVFIVLRHDRQRFLIRDRDGIYGDYFKDRMKNMRIEEVPIAPRSPWQNPYCERVIGSVRRECVNHLIVLSERHLYRILTDYFAYYHNSRLHLSLDRNSPTRREVESSSRGEMISTGQVGGLHHRYSRVRVIVNVGLPDWFGASGLRVTVKQPDSCGIPVFFAAIFSVVTQFDVCPAGWYNCRMEFLERTAIALR